MDIDFYISTLLYQLKNGEKTISQICELFPIENREKLKNLLENISFPVDFEYLRKITSLF